MNRRLPFTIPAIAAVAIGAIALAACQRQADAPATANDEVAVANEAMTANAMGGNSMTGAPQTVRIAGAGGAALGNVAVSEDAGGLTMTVTATGMPAGVHGIHLHEKGLCEGPKFASAGGHWNPGMKQHGRDNPQGAHLGDLANLTVAADGSATASFTIAGAMMASGAKMLADADGTALVVHAKADDYKTDPSGDSGDRIACAVVAAAK